MKLWFALDKDLNMVDIFTKEPLWDGYQWDQDPEFTASMVMGDAELLLPQLPKGDELLEFEVIWGGRRKLHHESTTEEEE